MLKSKKSEPTEYEIKLSRNCYYVCLGAGAVFALGWLILRVLDISLLDISGPPCVLYTYLGLYCPGCGGTRAVDSLMHMHLLRSLWYHPLVPYTAAVGGCYVLSHTLNILTSGKVRAMLFRPIYLYLAAAVVFVNWIVKDALILIFGIYLIG